MISKESLKTGDKVYAVCMGKSIAMFRIGKEPLENGMNILGAHIDSPRLMLKQNPYMKTKNLLTWIRITMAALRNTSG